MGRNKKQQRQSHHQHQDQHQQNQRFPLPSSFVNYYEKLELEQTATLDEVKIRYRSLALQFHPDKLDSSLSEGERKKCEERFKEIGEAYSVLSDPVKRRQYDLTFDQMTSFDFSGLENGGGEQSEMFRAFMEAVMRYGDRNPDELISLVQALQTLSSKDGNPVWRFMVQYSVQCHYLTSFFLSCFIFFILYKYTPLDLLVSIIVALAQFLAYGASFVFLFYIIQTRLPRVRLYRKIFPLLLLGQLFRQEENSATNENN